MFEHVPLLPSDPILGLIEEFRNDTRLNKIDLGVGVYRDDQGATPVMKAVKQAEQHILHTEQTKTYIGPQGNQSFNRLLMSLILSESLSIKLQHRCVLMQTPGGCGALRVAAELIKRTSASTKVWVSDPTWGNHMPLLGDAGLTLGTYPYYDNQSHTLRFDAMIHFLSEHASQGDSVLLHGSCHNPSGADLTLEQWQEITLLCSQKGLIPFVDMAYQGFGTDMDTDAYGLRYLCEHLDEVIFAYSCSKNFGLYRERVGAVGILAKSSQSKDALSSQIQTIVRGIYSMPPSHGAMVVEHILSDSKLRALWQDELTQKRNRIVTIRHQLCQQFERKGHLQAVSHLMHAKGMFSFLGVSQNNVSTLASQYGIYMVGSSRINLAGITSHNCDYFVQSVCDLLDK